MVNFEKMRSVYNILKTIKDLQNFEYPFETVKSVADMLIRKELLSEDVMDTRSKEVEPRKPKPENTNSNMNNV